MSRPKEPEFFNEEANFSKGFDWYSKCWSHYAGEKHIGEATPRYTRRDLWPDVPSRIRTIGENIKLVHIARHPYEKLVSFWRMYARGVTSGTAMTLDDFFEGDLRIPEIINSCRFEYQLAPYLNLFPESHLYLMTLEDLSEKPVDTLRGLFTFLEIDVASADKLASMKANEAKPSGGFLAKLRAFYRNQAPKRFVPRQELNAQNYQTFAALVRADADGHLARIGKPSSFWKWRSDS